jgi:hypothetical protein
MVVVTLTTEAEMSIFFDYIVGRNKTLPSIQNES